MARPEYERFRNALESLVERTVEALERGREEVLREARVGKVKLLDIYQLRRERGRLFQRLGEEVYGLIKQGALNLPAVSRTVSRIAALDEKIRTKESEVEDLRGDGVELEDFEAPPAADSVAPEGQPRKAAAEAAPAPAAKVKKKSAKKKPSKKKRGRARTLGDGTSDGE